MPDIDCFVSNIGSTKAKVADKLKKIDKITQRANLDIDIELYDFVDYFFDLENELSKYYGLESFFIFKKDTQGLFWLINLRLFFQKAIKI